MTVDRVEAVLPKANQSAPGGVIEKQIIIKGFSLDNRPLSNDDIEERYYSTKKNFLEKGIMVKVKIGHYQEFANNEEGQKLKGFIKSMELRKDAFENDFAMSIWAELHLYPEVLKDYKDGRYPEVSIADNGSKVMKDKDGNDIDKIIEHVALLGSERAAIPSLKAHIKSIYSNFLNTENKNSTKESKSMDEEFRRFLLAMQDLIKAKLEKSSSSESGDSKSGKANDKATDEKEEDEMDKKETKSISMAAATKAFSKLVSDGHLVNDDRSSYDELLEKTKDIDFAVKHFSRKDVKTPPTGEKTKSDRDETAIEKSMSTVKSFMTRMGYDPDDEKYKKIAEDAHSVLKEEGE